MLDFPPFYSLSKNKYRAKLSLPLLEFVYIHINACVLFYIPVHISNYVFMINSDTYPLLSSKILVYDLSLFLTLMCITRSNRLRCKKIQTLEMLTLTALQSNRFWINCFATSTQKTLLTPKTHKETKKGEGYYNCLLYTSDAADERK